MVTRLPDTCPNDGADLQLGIHRALTGSFADSGIFYCPVCGWYTWACPECHEEEEGTGGGQ